MIRFARPALYALLMVGIVGGLLWAGLIPTPSSAADRIVSQWEADFSARVRRSDEGQIVQLTIGSKDFGTPQAQQLVEMIDVERLDLTGTSIDDEALKSIAQMRSLKSLRLDGTSVTDAGLSCLSTCSTLIDLSLSRCDPGRLSVKGLGSIESLESLNLMGTSLTDEDVDALRNLASLERLYLGNCGLTSACLSALTTLDRLELLNLTGLGVGNDGDFAQLGRMSTLELLYLDHSALTDPALATYVDATDASSSSISSVFLEGCAITDESKKSLIKLVSLPEFTKLRLTGTKVSREVFDEIRAMFPDISYAHGVGGMSED